MRVDSHWKRVQLNYGLPDTLNTQRYDHDLNERWINEYKRGIILTSTADGRLPSEMSSLGTLCDLIRWRSSRETRQTRLEGSSIRVITSKPRWMRIQTCLLWLFYLKATIQWSLKWNKLRSDVQFPNRSEENIGKCWHCIKQVLIKVLLAPNSESCKRRVCSGLKLTNVIKTN